MTGNIRHAIGLLLVGLLLALAGIVVNAAGAGDFAAMLLVLGIVVGLIALVRIAADLLRPQRD